MNKKVLVGMSGGVDSSVSAALLMQKGYDTAGVFIRFHHDEKSFEESLNSASDVANKLGIKLYVRDYRNLFEDKVVHYFIEQYHMGKTPNPCILCNREVKFKALIESADALGYDYVATGHYCRNPYNHESKRFELAQASDSKKDQTYFLYRLSQSQLGRMIMPLAEYDKEKVREIALNLELTVAQKKDSQEVCFIPDGDYYAFIRKMTAKASPEGDFVDKEGRVLGRHRGIIRYTVGQRKGLGISLGKPCYVTAIDPAHNHVVLGDENEILSRWLLADNLNMVALNSFEKPIRAFVKIRSTAAPSPAWIYPSDDRSFKAIFDEPQRAITPGQSAVVYLNDRVLGGGIITKGGS